MTTVLVIDTDPTWAAHCLEHGATVCQTAEAALEILNGDLDGAIGLVVISPAFISQIPALKKRAKVKVVSNAPSIDECVRAYKAGASDYGTKTFEEAKGSNVLPN